MVEGFSLTERNRRWTRVRALMAAAAIDILVVPDEANLRYLTQLGDAAGAVVFPLNGEVTVFSDLANPPAPTASWLTDLRPLGNSWAAAAVARLGELRAEGRIVGITGLDAYLAAPEEALAYNSFIALRESFPHIRWVGASSLLREARHVKSAEEVALLTRATAVADAAFGELANHLHGSVSDRELWGRMVLAMLQAGGDPPRLVEISLSASDERPAPVGPPIGHVARAGSLCVALAAGRCQGYEAGGIQPLAVGPLPESWSEAWKVHAEVWQRTWEMLRPGVPHAALISAAESASSGPFRADLAFQGQGLGADWPMVPNPTPLQEGGEPIFLHDGACLVLKPTVVWSEGGHQRRLTWGDTILVTGRGPTRLGHRPHELVVCH